MNFKETIIEYCKTLNLDTVGFMKCRVFEELIPIYEQRKREGLENPFEEADIEKRVNPFFLLPEGKSIVSIAFPYYFDADYSPGKGFSIYTLGQDYHQVAGDYLARICSFIEGLGGKAKAFVDSNPLPERYIASLCGIGFIGKNNMLITEKYGSFVFLGEIITDIELGEDSEFGGVNLENLLIYERCGSCDRCLKSCPTKAISDKKRNPNICLSYITQKKDIEDKWFKVMGNRLFGCDSCQNCCPYNSGVRKSPLQELKPKNYMLHFDIEEVISVDKRTFQDKYKITSCGWRGKNVLQRNSLIYAKNNGIALERFSNINSPYVKDYYNRLLSKDKL